jgi:hypothetical protein
MDEQRKTYLLKLVRGKDFRRALHAIAELRLSRDSVGTVAESVRADEQRPFQIRVARIVLESDVEGLVEAWATLGDAKWRAELISEIGQFVNLWGHPAVNDLVLAALEDSSRQVQIKGVWCLMHYIREPSVKKTKAVRSASERRSLDGAQRIRGSITAAQRSRMTRALAAMLERHRQEPYPVLSQMVELLGYTANSDDKAVIQALEALCSKSGEPHRVSYERVDKSQFEWFDKLVLAKKGVDPDEMVRIKYTPTGLLDKKLLEATLARIRQR